MVQVSFRKSKHGLNQLNDLPPGMARGEDGQLYIKPMDTNKKAWKKAKRDRERPTLGLYSVGRRSNVGA